MNKKVLANRKAIKCIIGVLCGLMVSLILMMGIYAIFGLSLILLGAFLTGVVFPLGIALVCSVLKDFKVEYDCEDENVKEDNTCHLTLVKSNNSTSLGKMYETRRDNDISPIVHLELVGSERTNNGYTRKREKYDKNKR